jgi:predicted esterase
MQSKAVRGLAVALLMSACAAADDGTGTGRPTTTLGTVMTGTGGAHAGTGGMHAGPVGATGTGGATSVQPGGGTMNGAASTGGPAASGSGGKMITGPIGISGIGQGSGGSSSGGGVAGMGGGGTPITNPMLGTAKDPVIPEVTGECPDFSNGIITFMGLGGIEIVAGPAPSTPTAPMVFYWHGTGGLSGEYATMAADVVAGVVAEGGVLVSFQDTTGGDLNSGTFIFGASDFNLTDQLLACAVKNHNIDPHRVFATGCSAGGLFSDAMGALRSSYMAAVASNSGGFPVLSPAFENDHTPALMTIHGAAGVDVVAIDFSEASALADMDYKGRGGFVINCDHGGGHCGGAGFAPDIWNFFENHPFGVDPEPWASGLPPGFNPVCVIK